MVNSQVALFSANVSSFHCTVIEVWETQTQCRRVVDVVISEPLSFCEPTMLREGRLHCKWFLSVMRFVHVLKYTC